MKSEKINKIELTGADVGLQTVWQVSRRPLQVQISLNEAARQKVGRSRQYIESKMREDAPIYGVNTGFGAFSSVRISQDQIETLQRNLIRSHCTGVGDPFTREQTRAIMFLRANALATGNSGIRPEVIEKILEFLNKDLIPVIPQQGSVGASGDLAPLSHLALALIGEGQIWQGDLAVPAQTVLQEAQVQPLVLQAKEGLSLINGCQVMTAVGLLAAYEARRLLWMTDVAGAMTLEAMRGTRAAFDPLISKVRPHHGEAQTARNILKVLGSTSEIAQSHADCDRVQDAYSLRCMPAVHGAAKNALRNGVATLEIEANSSTDNPLVFAEEEKILSGGNFHGEPAAFALDFMAIAVSAMASISECRIEKLINPSMSGLPAFLAPDGGLNSGHMIVQVSAASLVSENKILSHPASVDSIPTSADKEDHVSMGTIAARKFVQIVKNAENIVAMEFLSATQALDFLKPLKPNAGVKAAYDVVRKQVPFAEKDRIFSVDIEAIKKLIRNEEILNAVVAETGELEW
jgi:histidine ammonia-lyase